MLWQSSTRTVLTVAVCLGLAPVAMASPVYVALGDSITFGETNLQYVPSNGDQGYVAAYANYLAAQNGGVRPNVINLAIDGETAASFMTGAGRVPPVVGRTDAILASENTNYNPAALVSQNALFLSQVANQKALGNTISTVSITLGFNDLTTAVGQSPAQVAAILATYQTQYSAILGEIRQQLPSANLIVLGYYNPFPADPTNPAAPTFNTYGTQLNALIGSLAAQYNANFVNPAPAFVGHEAEFTYMGQMPHGSASPPVGPYQGVEPNGNVHPNATGYGMIAAAIESVPEPASVVLTLVGVVPTFLLACRRR